MPGNTARPRGGDGDARACAEPRQLDLEADGLGVAPTFVDNPRQLAFDYSELDSEIRSVAVEAAAKIKRYGRQAAQSIANIGIELIVMRQALPRGKWLPWLKTEFGWSEDTAERFMQVARLKEHIPQIAEYRIDVSALYLLAAPKTPKEVRELVAEKAAAGEPVKHSFVKNLVAKVKKPSRGPVATYSEVEDAELVGPDDPPTGKAAKRSDSSSRTTSSAGYGSVIPTPSKAYRVVIEFLGRMPISENPADAMPPEEAAAVERKSEIETIDRLFPSAVEWFDRWATAWRSLHHEPAPAAPPADLVHGILGHVVCFQDRHPDTTGPEILEALDVVRRHVVAGELPSMREYLRSGAPFREDVDGEAAAPAPSEPEEEVEAAAPSRRRAKRRPSGAPSKGKSPTPKDEPGREIVFSAPDGSKVEATIFRSNCAGRPFTERVWLERLLVGADGGHGQVLFLRCDAHPDTKWPGGRYILLQKVFVLVARGWHDLLFDQSGPSIHDDKAELTRVWTDVRRRIDALGTEVVCDFIDIALEHHAGTEP